LVDEDDPIKKQKKLENEAHRIMIKRMDVRAQELFRNGTEDTDDIIERLVSESMIPEKFYDTNQSTGLIEFNSLRNRIDDIKTRKYSEDKTGLGKTENTNPETKSILDYIKKLEEQQRRAADQYLVLQGMIEETIKLYKSGTTGTKQIAASLINTDHMPDEFYRRDTETGRVKLLDRAIRIIEHTKKEIEQGKDERE